MYANWSFMAGDRKYKFDYKKINVTSLPSFVLMTVLCRKVSKYIDFTKLKKKSNSAPFVKQKNPFVNNLHRVLIWRNKLTS